MKSMEHRKPQVLVIDDHPLVRKGLVSLLTSDHRIGAVIESDNPDEGMSSYRRLRPDLLVTDLRMPLKHGTDLIKEVISFDPDARILVLTAVDGDQEISNALQAGAKGYLLKSASDGEVLDAVLNVAMGRKHIPSYLSSALAASVHADRLSERELTITRLVSQGLTNQAIASQMGVSIATVKFHMTHIMQKLGCSNRTEVARTAHKRGIIR